MQTKSYMTVQFALDENEKEIMKSALEIMRKFREKFLTSNMPEHDKQLAECLSLLYDIIHEEEISE